MHAKIVRYTRLASRVAVFLTINRPTALTLISKSERVYVSAKSEAQIAGGEGKPGVIIA
jgi:hypothetical protein